MTTPDDPTVPAEELPRDISTAGAGAMDSSAPDASDGQGSRGAARLLEVAARNADELLTEATAEAEQLVAAAREQADELMSGARADAQKVRAELEETRAELNADVARLRDLEHEQRDRMRSHLTDLLAQIDADRPT